MFKLYCIDYVFVVVFLILMKENRVFVFYDEFVIFLEGLFCRGDFG